MKIGLYFGSFNPIHMGHLIIAHHMVEFSDLDKIWFVVSPHNPFKKKETLLADHHRLELVQLALKDFDKLEASNIEFGLKKPSYTIDTLAYISEKHSNHEFSLIMGGDNLTSFHKWKNYETILEHHHIYVYPRTTGKPCELDTHPSITIVKSAPMMQISSSFIRKSIADNKDIRSMLPKTTWNFIDEMNFYRPKPKIN